MGPLTKGAPNGYSYTVMFNSILAYRPTLRYLTKCPHGASFITISAKSAPEKQSQTHAGRQTPRRPLIC